MMTSAGQEEGTVLKKERKTGGRSGEVAGQ